MTIPIQAYFVTGAIVFPLLSYILYEAISKFVPLSENVLVSMTFITFGTSIFMAVLTTPGQFTSGLGPFGLSLIWIMKMAFALIAPSAIITFSLRLNMK